MAVCIWLQRATLDITGTFNAGGDTQIVDMGKVTLRNSAAWNLRGSGNFVVGYSGGDIATLNIQDSATLNVDRSVGGEGSASHGSLVLGMGILGSSYTGSVNQNGGTFDTTDFSSCVTGNGPGIILGGTFPGGQVQATYNLNGGTLHTSGVFNVNEVENGSGQWTLSPPSDVNQVATFNFNGGILQASQSDSADAEIVAESLGHLVGNLSHADVQAGGAKIDSNGFTVSINQSGA